MQRPLALAIIAFSILLVAAMLSGAWYWKKVRYDFTNPYPEQPLLKVESVTKLADHYDVIVTGSDPEGIAAAVSAARNGQSVLLADGKHRTMLGGLMTEGGLNTIDFNYAPEKKTLFNFLRKPDILNKGIFQEWYNQVEGTSFDVVSAANAFYRMVHQQEGLDLLMNVRSMEPITEQLPAGKAVTGIRFVLEDGSTKDIQSGTVIDATQDADIAAAAGAPFTMGREDIGDSKSLMVATLVFKLDGVTQEVWEEMGRHNDAKIDRMSIWGYHEAREYKPTDPAKVKMRSLNIGRQNDGSVLINSMQLFDINPLDPESVRRGIETGQHEAPLIVDFLKKRFPAFANVKYGGTAAELYIRESRHIKGEYRLTLADVMENRDHPDAVAYGSYAIDIQSTSSGQIGTILMNPEQYGIPFGSLVPLEVDRLLVVGRAASFDTLPHGSARVIPVGMATGEAAGAAAKLAEENHTSLRELSRSDRLMKELRTRLKKQGMDLSMKQFEFPSYMTHKAYKGLLAAASMYLTSGSYSNNEWDLDGTSNPQRFVNMMRRVKAVHPEHFPNDPMEAIRGLDQPRNQPLTLDEAAYIICHSAGRTAPENKALDDLQELGWISEETLKSIDKPESLSNGEVFMLIRDLTDYYLNIRYK
ncbi:FAD-dependent oxidoreductase [Paenibacillus pinihumi]|uniref:FAD-dependent oxidoreductase n=1 Tax=Paenibacillus pinihumi TaxID=669462 RepID=UPI00048CBCB4|nr:FAD-dependent oxidoreductase [Paenibacillus pinihumi]